MTTLGVAAVSDYAMICGFPFSKTRKAHSFYMECVSMQGTL